jgi:hypothetical protein
MKDAVVALTVAMGLCAIAAPSPLERVLGVVAGGPSETLSDLEAAAAAQPDAVGPARKLGQAYLDARLPGLAVAFLERSPAARTDGAARHLLARALLDVGRNDAALAVEREVLSACGAAEGGRGCDAVLAAASQRRADILREMLAMGVEDVLAKPEASRIAYMNATREARIAPE